MNKNYNIFTKQYRFIKLNLLDEFPLSIIFSEHYLTGYEYVEKKYRPYLFYLLYWTILKITNSKSISAVITGSLIAVFGTVIGYASLKFVLHWI